MTVVSCRFLFYFANCMPCLLANIVDYYRVASWTLSHSFIMASEAGRRLYKNYTFYFALLSFSSELC